MTELENILRDQREELMRINFKQFVSRKEEKDFELDSDLAQIVIGVRRSGKSTLCQKVLKESGVKFAYVNFDDERFMMSGEKGDIVKDGKTIHCMLAIDWLLGQF